LAETGSLETARTARTSWKSRTRRSGFDRPVRHCLAGDCLIPGSRDSIGVCGCSDAAVTPLDEVVVALFVSSGENTTITKVMFSSLRDEIDPTIAAVSSLLIIGSVVVAGLAMLSTRLGNQRRRS
jgi:hypothetical protein